MDGKNRSCGWDMEIPHGVLPMEQLVLSDKWARIISLAQGHNTMPSVRPNPVTPQSQVKHSIYTEPLHSHNVYIVHQNLNHVN